MKTSTPKAKLPADQQRTILPAFRISPAEDARLRNACKKLKTTQSAIMRNALLRALDQAGV